MQVGLEQCYLHKTSLHSLTHTHTHTAPSSSHHGAAVAILQGGGGVRGLVRMVQVTPEQCVVEGTVDGLTPGQHAIQVHQYGDLSEGCAR